MKQAIYVTTMIVRELIKRGEYTLYHEDGRKVEPEEYFWDESQFEIEVVSDGKRIKVSKE